jgi:hypothetical protein
MFAVLDPSVKNAVPVFFDVGVCSQNDSNNKTKMLELAAILPHLFPVVGAVFSFLFMTVVVFILIKGIRGIRVADLFEFGGEASLSKFWQNVAYAAATIAFLAVNISGNLTGGTLEVVWLIYLGVVASNAVLSKWISVKYDRGASDETPPAPETPRRPKVKRGTAVSNDSPTFSRPDSPD